MKLSDLYRRLPHFRGKYSLGKALFPRAINQSSVSILDGQRGLRYNVLNTSDSIGRDIFFDGIYEPETIRLIESLVKKGDVIVDAGANIGAVSLPVAKIHDVQIYAFEPAPNIYRVLEENISLNKIGNIKAVNAALSDNVSETDFYESDRVHGWSGLVKIDSFRRHKVDTNTLAAFCAEQQIERVTVLKMDVQGWEYFVLKGAEKLLLEDRIEHIIFEFEWWAEENAGLKPGATQEYLMELGFRLMNLQGEVLQIPVRTGTVMLWATKQSDVSNII